MGTIKSETEYDGYKEIARRNHTTTDYYLNITNELLQNNKH